MKNVFLAVILISVVFGIVFFAQTASAQNTCNANEVELFDSSGSIFCAPDANSNGVPDFAESSPTPTPAVPSWMSTYVDGRNSVPTVIPAGFDLSDLIVSDTYRAQLFVGSANVIHEPTGVISFSSPTMVTLDVPRALQVTLVPGQSAIACHTQSQQIVLYHNDTAANVTFDTIPTDAVRGWTEIDESLFSFWYLRMLASEWTRLPNFFEIVLVS